MKTIEQIRDELAGHHSYDNESDTEAAFAAGFDKRGEIDKEEIAKLKQQLEQAIRLLKNHKPTMDHAENVIEKLKRVIKVLKTSINMEHCPYCTSLYQTHYDFCRFSKALSEADAIIGDKK